MIYLVAAELCKGHVSGYAWSAIIAIIIPIAVPVYCVVS